MEFNCETGLRNIRIHPGRPVICLQTVKIILNSEMLSHIQQVNKFFPLQVFFSFFFLFFLLHLLSLRPESIQDCHSIIGGAFISPVSCQILSSLTKTLRVRWSTFRSLITCISWWLPKLYFWHLFSLRIICIISKLHYFIDTLNTSMQTWGFHAILKACLLRALYSFSQSLVSDSPSWQG